MAKDRFAFPSNNAKDDIASTAAKHNPKSADHATEIGPSSIASQRSEMWKERKNNPYRDKHHRNRKLYGILHHSVRDLKSYHAANYHVSYKSY